MLVITPDSYADGKARSVVYLLHGFGDNHRGWLDKCKLNYSLSDSHNVILVLPEGEKGWYIDSPVDENSKYESYFCNELIPLVDSLYRTIDNRKGRAITGLSMGGHGALYLAIKHQDLFSAAGSMSGGVDLRPFPTNWNLIKILGDQSNNRANWDKHCVANMLTLIKPNSLDLIIDCGTDDFFYKVNCELHDKLLEMKVPHDFISRPGSHNWNYWSNAVQYQMIFFTDRLATEKYQLKK